MNEISTDDPAQLRVFEVVIHVLMIWPPISDKKPEILKQYLH